MNRKNITLLVMVLALCLSSSQALTQEWPQWRGGNRDGVVADFSTPQSWPESLKLKWKVSIGDGYASPIVANGRIYTLIRNEEQEQEVASCLNLATGEILWQTPYPVSYTPNRAAARHGKNPKSTPVLHDGKLFTLSITGVLSCFDADTGVLKWRKEFSDKFAKTSPIYGAAMSPLVDRDLLIAHVGGQNHGALIACDVETGEIKWSWDGDGPAYASPIVAEFGGTRQIITQTQKYCVGVSADTGKLLWSIPFTTPYDQNTVTPVLYKGMVIFSGTKNGTMAVKIVKQGDAWSTEQVWHNPDVSMYLNSPVVSGDLLFGFSSERSCHFFCLNPQTGETLWESDGKQGENAAILSAGDTLLLLTNDAKLTIVKQSSEGFEPITQYKVADDQAWAHPAPLGKQMLIKDISTLYLWSME